MKDCKLALVGATGLVGRTALKVLEEFNLPISNYTFFRLANLLEASYIFKIKTT